MTNIPGGFVAPETAARDTFGERVGDDTLRFQRHFAAPPERVWRAITTPEGLAAWIAPATRIEPYAGGAFEIRFNDEDRMDGRIVALEPNRRLVVAWRECTNGTPSHHTPAGHDESIVTFELSPAPGGGTDLDFTHAYVLSGDRMIGFAAGWHGHLEALAAVVAGRESPAAEALYLALRPHYEGRLARP